jgi:FkbM family methyltransferase
LRRLGVDVIRYPPHPDPLPPQSFSSRRGLWMRSFGISVVLDVGANAGQYAKEIRRLGYLGRIVSLEPQTSAFSALEHEARTDSRWQCLRLALGPSESTGEINIAANSESSSILPMELRHVTACPESAYVSKEEIRVTTLDWLQSEVLRPDDVVWLKMDVQGYEMSVLAGGQTALEQVVCIEMELSVETLYTGSLLLCESIDALKGKGYHLIALEEGFLDGRSLHVLQLNGIFERRR